MSTPPTIVPPAPLTPAFSFDSIEVGEVVAFELFKSSVQERDDAEASVQWREDRSMRTQMRASAKLMFEQLEKLGLKLSAGKKAAITSRVMEIDTIPASKAYDLATDAAS